jgi:hypothetical protein
MAKKAPKKPQKIGPLNKAKKPKKTDYDSPWKDFIELYFRDFLKFFFPEIEADIDWDRVQSEKDGHSTCSLRILHWR